MAKIVTNESDLQSDPTESAIQQALAGIDLASVPDSYTASRYAVSSVDQGNTPTLVGAQIGGNSGTVGPSGNFTFVGLDSVAVARQANLVEMSLVGDEASPGASVFYGTDASGTRGFYGIPSVSNYAINGAFDIWQAGHSFTHTGGVGVGTGNYDADCWGTWASNSSVATTRVAATDVPESCRYICQDVVTGVAGDSTVLFRTLNIPNVKVLAGKTVAIPMWVRSYTTANIAVQFVQVFGYVGASSLGAASVGHVGFSLQAGVWTKIVPVFTIPEVTGPTPDPGTSGMQLRLYMNAGALYAFPDVNIGTASGQFDWALVTIREGGDGTILPYPSDTLLQCQQFFEKSFPLDAAPVQNYGTSGAWIVPQVVGASTPSQVMTVGFKVTKQGAPTITLFNPSAANAHVRDLTVNADWSAEVIAAYDESFNVQATSPAGSAAGNQAAFHWQADARIGGASAWFSNVALRDVAGGDVRITSSGAIRRCFPA